MVDVAVNGQIAVDMVRAHMTVNSQEREREGEGEGEKSQYDFICMDFTMPVMVRNDPSTLRQANQHVPHCPSHLFVANHNFFLTIISYYHLPSLVITYHHLLSRIITYYHLLSLTITHLIRRTVTLRPNESVNSDTLV